MFINYFTNINNSCLNFNFWGYNTPNFNFGYNLPIFNFNNFTPNFNSYSPFFQQNFFNTNFYNFNNSIWNQSFTPNFYNNFNSPKNSQTTSSYQQQTPISFKSTITSKTRTSSTTSSTTGSTTSSTTSSSTSIKQSNKTELQTTYSSSASKTYTGSLSNYNPTKGNTLAEIALKNAGYVIDARTKEVTSKRKDPQDFTKCCARYVQTAISDANLDDGIGRVSSAYLMTQSLSKNSNFEEISSSTPLKDLPPGTVIIYDKGVQGYSKKHGHVEIITKDGRAVSDGITDYLYKKPSHIFIPV